MIIECRNCKTKFNLDNDATAQSSFMVRCSVCEHLFKAYKPSRIQEITFLDLEQARTDTHNDNIFAISNRKGGVAKTTTCMNLGASLALHKKKVLLVDFDAQANLTLCLNQKQLQTFYDAQREFRRPLNDFIFKTSYPNLWLLPSGRNMVLLNKQYFGAPNFEFMLKDRLRAVKEDFDFILIDTPPSIGFFTLNALTAANRVIIPCQCDYMSAHGVDQVLQLISLVGQKSNPGIQFKILLTLLNQKDSASQLILSKIKDLYKGQIFDTVIGVDADLKEAQIMSMPAIQYRKESVAGIQYVELAREIISAMNGSEWTVP